VCAVPAARAVEERVQSELMTGGRDGGGWRCAGGWRCEGGWRYVGGWVTVCVYSERGMSG
jgi:hypothetical protein